MPATTADRPFTCVTCQAAITGPVTFHVGLPFCCAGCVADGPCICSYDVEPVVAGVHLCRDVTDLVGDPPITADAREPVAARR